MYRLCSIWIRVFLKVEYAKSSQMLVRVKSREIFQGDDRARPWWAETKHDEASSARGEPAAGSRGVSCSFDCQKEVAVAARVRVDELCGTSSRQIKFELLLPWTRHSYLFLIFLYIPRIVFFILFFISPPLILINCLSVIDLVRNTYILLRKCQTIMKTLSTPCFTIFFSILRSELHSLKL